MYGYDPNVSSWGGNPVLGDDKKWHLYVAEMRTGGLVGWGHESECTHAVASSISGPYLKADEVLTPECHNPSTVRDPKTGEILLFHIGTGPNTKNSSSFMHHASNPSGPWTPASTGTKCNNPGMWPVFQCIEANN